MRFQNLYNPRIDQMDDVALTAFVREYRIRRSQDIIPVVSDIPAMKASKTKLSATELALLKSIGLTPRLLKSLREESVEDDDDTGLFEG